MPCGAPLSYYHMTRRAVLPKSNTGTGVFGRHWTLNRFYSKVVFNPELLNICEFVWQPGIFLKVSGVMVFVWRGQIVKRICNGRD